jgi:hypothetical protein
MHRKDPIKDSKLLTNFAGKGRAEALYQSFDVANTLRTSTL